MYIKRLMNICGNPCCVNPERYEEYRALKYYCPQGHIVGVGDVKASVEARMRPECARENAREQYYRNKR